MSEWKEVRLGEYIEFNPYRKLRKGDKAKKITMDMLIPYSKQIYDFIVEPYNGGAKFQNGDTIMARITPCLENGKHAYIDILDKDEIAYGSTEYIVLCGKADVTDNEFVYYFSHSPIFKNTAIKSMVGSSGRQRAQTDVLKELIVNVPISISDQKEIAGILSSLDAKIETNNKLNEKLEEMAQAIFKSWFVDFEPFKDKPFHETEIGMIPEGWEVFDLGSFFPVKTGKKDANVASKKGEYPFFSCSQNILYTDSYSFEGSAILIAGNGDFNVKYYCGKFEAYQRTYVLIPYDDNLSSLLFYAIKYYLNKITSGSRGSVIKFITKGSIQKFKIAFPKEIKEYSVTKILKIINNIISNNKKENDRLASLRDTLLPRLMSGELKV